MIETNQTYLMIEMRYAVQCGSQYESTHCPNFIDILPPLLLLLDDAFKEYKNTDKNVITR